MTTVIAVYNSSGCVGRCDARCHEATGPDCKCICGGGLHGIGTKAAKEDARYLSDEELIEETIEILTAPGRSGPKSSSLSIIRSEGRVVKKALRVFRYAEQLELFPAGGKISNADSTSAAPGPTA